MENKQFKTFTVPELKEFNDSERSITHFITTETPDRSGDIVRADGCDSKAFTQNPVVLWAHDYSEPPIGKCLWMKTAEREGVKGILVKTQFANTEDAQEIYDLWKGGFLNAASIGFLPIKSIDLGDGWWCPKEFIEWELLEYSIVPVPANSEALRNAVKSASPKVQSFISKAIAESERKTIEQSIAETNEKLDSIYKRFDAVLESIKELAKTADAETLAVKAYDMKSIISNAVGGKVSDSK